MQCNNEIMDTASAVKLVSSLQMIVAMQHKHFYNEIKKSYMSMCTWKSVLSKPLSCSLSTYLSHVLSDLVSWTPCFAKLKPF